MRPRRRRPVLRTGGSSDHLPRDPVTLTASTIAVTGSASGMGAALARLLRERGVHVIAVDRHHADVEADLATPDGRRTAVEAIQRLCDRSLDGVGTFAGLSGHCSALAADVASVNYFGTVDLLQRLRPLLADDGGGAAVAISSIGPLVHPLRSPELVEACLSGDEHEARAIAESLGRSDTYVATKLAVMRWVRRQAPDPTWIGSKISLNVVAPGFVRTPMVEEALAEAAGRSVVESFGVPAGRPGAPEEIAALVDFMLTPVARFLVGSVVVMDGGSEAAARADDWPVSPAVSEGQRGTRVPEPDSSSSHR